MIYPFSGPGAGTRILATVKWYDPVKGYGFLVPGDGSPDIYCREAALAAVGLDTLLAGATVACETTQGQRGPEVSRVHAVDFSTASPRTASFARTPGNEPIAAGASGRRVRALIKWFTVADQGLRVPGARGRFRRPVLPHDRRAGVRP